MMPERVDILRCPVCSGAFQPTSQELACLGCGRKYPVKNGITDFRISRHDYYFNPVPREEMHELIASITPATWPSAVCRFIGSTRNASSWIDNLVVDGRYAWKIFLSLGGQETILDIGCGLGNLVSNLAPHAATTYAMDLTFERLEFAHKRFSIFNPGEDIQLVAGGDAAQLPFADKSLDCVTLSGVLEWVGEGDMAPFLRGSKAGRLWRMLIAQFGRRGPRSMQLQFLKEIRRVLKDNGQLFIGIENRLNFDYLFDRPDHHSGLWWGSLLPRPIANLYSILRKRAPYRTYTYALAGYRRLLRQGGFGRTEFFSLFQGYSNLREIVPVDARLAHWRGTGHRTHSLGQRVRRCKYFVPAFGIIAHAGDGGRERLYDRLLAAVARAAGLGTTDALAIDAAHVSEKEKLLISGSAAGTPIMVRVPLNATARECEKTNHAMLSAIAASADCPDFIPRPIAAGDIEGLPFYIERRISGIPLSHLSHQRDKADILKSAENALCAVEAVQPPVREAFEGELYHRLVTAPIGDIDRAVEMPALGQKLTAYFRETVHGASVSVGIMHGDFSLSNVFAEGSRISGVIDWEAGSSAGVPAIDPINFVFSLDCGQVRASAPADRWARVASLLTGNTEESAFLKRFYRRHGIDPALHSALVHLHWLHVVGIKLKFGLAYNQTELGKFLYAVADRLPAGAETLKKAV